MKNIFALIGLFLVSVSLAWAQPTITLLTFESYTFADKFDTEYGTGKIEDGFQWGGGLEFGLSETMAVELIYQNLATNVSYQGFDRRYDGSAVINYALLGTIPAGISIHATTGIISWSNSVATGNYTLNVTATNSVGSTSTSYGLTVSASATVSIPSSFAYSPATGTSVSGTAGASSTPSLNNINATSIVTAGLIMTTRRSRATAAK